MSIFIIRTVKTARYDVRQIIYFIVCTYLLILIIRFFLVDLRVAVVQWFFYLCNVTIIIIIIAAICSYVYTQSRSQEMLFVLFCFTLYFFFFIKNRLNHKSNKYSDFITINQFTFDYENFVRRVRIYVSCVSMFS